MIMNILHQHQRTTIKELNKHLNVSAATLRTDLTQMEKEGLLIRTHGGAMTKEKTNDQHCSPVGDTINQIEKIKISQRAAQLIMNGQCIFLDASPIALELARILVQEKSRLTVVTNGIHAAMEMKENPNITVILIGGALRAGSTALEGRFGIDLLRRIHADILFTSASGFTIEDGLTDFNVYEIELKKEMVKAASRVVALLDHDKIGKISIASYASTEQIDVLITDSEAPHAFFDEIAAKQIELIVV
ncbi:transcriptional regulator [Paenibacillus ferrarius]|uniref:Transcriptional regulator n=2 Tax=Paenibacillus ferrarius TaxID=1469647 RepID=A0A1V4H7E1_9BACL|nr:transcriptional regulator [Paenibacillus ferrarius]